MKKVKSYSAQFKIIPQNENTQCTRSASGAFGINPSDENNIPNGKRSQQSCINEKNNKKKNLTKQNQEFINNISASGFKQFFS